MREMIGSRGLGGEENNLRGFNPEFESAAHVQRWVGDCQGGCNMLIFQVRGKEKGVFIHFAGCIGPFEHSVA